ncbi:MAG: SGNH/GDSL hydrolase family protein, partial [Candidatus Paceibacterota bacterium]
AENGMRSDQLLDRLDGLLTDESYDLVVIHIGANDVLRMRKLEPTKQNIGLIVDRSLDNADNVALFTSGNIGEAKLIPWFARPLISKRSLTLRDFGVKLESEIDNFLYVDLYYKDSGLPSSDFYTDDQLHLSDKGYGFWHQELRNALKKHTDLYY